MSGRASLRRKLWRHSSKSGQGLSLDSPFLPLDNLDNSKEKLIKQRSSESVHSADDDSDTEPSSSTILRRGRRQAIVDSKTLGVITAPDGGETSPTNSCDESESSYTGLNERRSKGSVTKEPSYNNDMVKAHRKKALIKRNTVHDFAINKSYQQVFDQDVKKNKMSFVMKLIDKKGNKGKEELVDLSDVLLTIKPTQFKDQSLISYKTIHWSELIASKEKDTDIPMVTDGEKQRREAVWEVFQSECVFLIDHLMVLKHCFMEPLKKVQVEGHLMFAEPQDLFGNLDELCYVSYTFCKDFISLLLKDARVRDFGRTGILVKALQRYSQLSRDGEVFHEYCLNYSKAINYLEILRKNDKFCEFERWCENDRRCHRLQLTDLLISPMQHCTKVPLLLQNITKYTQHPEEKQQLVLSLQTLQTSLNNLEAKMKWLKNFERVQEIQQQIQWQPITDLDPKAYIPEFLKTTLSRQPCEKLLASPKRQLLHEGEISLTEISKGVDMYMFLFDDILLLTKIKKSPRKKSDVDKTLLNSRRNTDGAVFIVHKQPIALDRFTVHDIKPPESSVSQMKHAFVLVQISRFQQIIGVYTLQVSSETAKVTWMSKLREAQDNYKKRSERKPSSITHANSFLVSCEEKYEDSLFDSCLSQVTEEGDAGDVHEDEEKQCESSSHSARHTQSHSGYTQTPSTDVNTSNTDMTSQTHNYEQTINRSQHINNNNNYIAGSNNSYSNSSSVFNGISPQTPREVRTKGSLQRKRTPHQAFRFTPEQIEKIQSSQRRVSADSKQGIDTDSLQSSQKHTSPTHVTSRAQQQQQHTYDASTCHSEHITQENGMNTDTRKRSSESVRADKINRLKAIHESSQSVDVIYI